MKNNKAYKFKIIEEQRSADTLAFGFTLSSPSKIAGHRPYAFSLPAGKDGTCPGETKACEGCYAKGGMFTFPATQSLMMRNWTTFSYFEARKDVGGAADALLNLISKKAPIFRIHVSGDFSSQFYIRVWTVVAMARPQTAFWFYTRSFQLNFKEFLSLPNVEGWASTDEYNKVKAEKFAIKHGIKQAFGPYDHDAAIPKNTVVCPVTSGKLTVENACFRCKLCIVKGRITKNILFLAH